jgi:sulfite dehydrogenase (quinone) subunit SoeC
MHGALSVLIFTVTSGLGQGLFVWLALNDMGAAATRLSPQANTAAGLLSLLLLGVGLLASFFHLGHPMRAWRAVAMWRTSWLSREVIVLPITMAVIFAWTFAQWTGFWDKSAFAITGIVLCFVLWYCTAMIYACLKFLQEWAHWSTALCFTLMGLASGAVLMALVVGVAAGKHVDFWFIVASGLTLLAGTVRFATMLRNANLRPKSTLQSALGIQNPIIRQTSQGAMGGSFNTREFFHGKRHHTVRNMRWLALVCGVILPLASLLMLGVVVGAALALVLQYAGLLAERWLFFADAKHPQNLYYQTVG